MGKTSNTINEKNEINKTNKIVGGTIRLYSSQMPPVLAAINRDGTCFSKTEYIQKKYQESNRSFLVAYEWFAKAAQELVEKPEGAQLPYWAFEDLYCVDQSADGNPPLTLAVPKDEVVLFDMYDWTKIIQLEYLGKDEEDTRNFKAELRRRGLKEYDIMMGQFYPEWKSMIYKSWENLFRHHNQLIQGNHEGVKSVQAALWQIKKDWVR